MSASARPALDNLANNSPTLDLRARRWARRGVVWKVTELKRCALCGRAPISATGRIGLRKNGQQVGYSGLQTCGSVWVCPVCNSKIMAERRIELGVLMAQCISMGYGLAFGAFTLRHRLGDALGNMLGGLSYSWDRMMRARVVRRLLDGMEYLGYVRSTEIMVSGLTGWHPHIHPLLIFKREVSEGEVDALYRAMVRVWKQAAAAKGMRAPEFAGQRLSVVTDAGKDLADYLAKATLDSTAPEAVGWEMTGQQTKHGRSKGSRSPWHVLDDLGRDGDAGDLALWLEYEAATKGKRSITYSKGIREMLPRDERTDEEIAAEEVGDKDDTLFWILDWAPIAEHPAWGGELLTAVQHGGLDAGLAYCREHGIAVEVVA